MTAVIDRMTEVQDQIIETLAKTKAPVSNAVSTFVGYVVERVPQVPAVPFAEQIPTPKELIDNQAKFASKLVTTNKSVALAGCQGSSAPDRPAPRPHPHAGQGGQGSHGGLSPHPGDRGTDVARVNPPSRSAPERRTHPPVVLRSASGVRFPAGPTAPAGPPRPPPIASDAVAAGDGALSTCTPRGDVANAKSSSRVPSAASAWARMPAPAGTRSSGPTSGSSRRTSRSSSRCDLDRSELLATRPPVARRQTPQRPVAHERGQVPAVDAAPVGLASEREHGVRADVHRAVDHPGHVHPEERPARVGNGVHQVAHQPAGRRLRARGTRRGTARSTPRRPARSHPRARATRSLCRPAQFTNHRTRSRSSASPASSTWRPPSTIRTRSTRTPVRSSPPPSTSSSARARATAP